MISLTSPSSNKISEMYENSSHELSYLEVGESLKPNLPEGYHHIDYSEIVGSSFERFVELKTKMKNWNMLNLPWITLQRANDMKPGEIVIFTIKYYFLKFTVMDKIVDVIETGTEFKMAYGTLSNHVEIGEEVFILAINPDTEEITFQIKSFSKVKNPIFRLGNPLIRRLQLKFVKDVIAQLKN